MINLGEALLKAIVYTQYGPPDVLELKEAEKPVPRDNGVLIKVNTASVNAYDWRMMRAEPFLVRLMGGGFLRPKNTIPGIDVAGRVEAVGKDVKQFRPGDEVFGSAIGCFAEYVCASEKYLALKPGSMTFEEAAAIPLAALTALQGLRDKGKIQSGQRVLINGASGGVGSFAVQIAKSFGAEVTAVCSTRNLGTVNTISADYVIDYTQEDFTKSEQRYDLILAVNGYHSIFDYKRALLPMGNYVMAGGSTLQLLQGMLLGKLLSATGSKKVSTFMAQINQKDLIFMTELFESGKVMPVIDRSYALSEAADAIRYMEDEHTRGKVVIKVENND